MSADAALKRTPLYELHLELGARMVPFAGYAMPVQYPAGVLKEHAHTRTQAGLFDVSHMGQIRVSGRGASAALETLVPADVVDLAPNAQRYALFTNESGGILDDLMIAADDDGLFLVANAACKEQDLAHLRSRLGDRCRIDELADRALLALQGPAASRVLGGLLPGVERMIFMTTTRGELAGAECFISRSGYTGEDGYEISVPAVRALALARELLARSEVAPIGLGARDSLRLEAGLCLYGHDIDVSTTPVEAGLAWVVSKARRPGGVRPGGYPGAEVIATQLAHGVRRKRVGLVPRERVPVREGAELIAGDGRTVGKVTSGSFGPTRGAPVAMGYVETGWAAIGAKLSAVVRGRPVPIEVAAMPFVPQRYYRG